MMIVSPSPHIHNNDSVRKNMLNVVIALIPAYLVALYYFGFGALIVSLISIVSCLLFEWLIQKYLLKKPCSLGNMSALVTGVLLSFNLPSNLDWWIVVIGALVAIGIGKMTFGGLGNNPFNPALVGRVFLLVSFPVQMTTWPRPMAMNFNLHYLDAATGATNLSLINEKTVDNVEKLSNLDYLSQFLGYMGGSMGEVSAIALLIGLVYLLCTKTITWHIPVSIIATVLILTSIAYMIDPIHIAEVNGEKVIQGCYASPLFHLLSGGLLLGAIFMATDYVTSPMAKSGQLIYGVGIGILTVVIRFWGAYPEGMSFAILIMNAVTPLINHYVKPRRFGEVVKK